MLMRTDPFRELDQLTERVLGTRAHPAGMPIDAYRRGEQFVVEIDLPGVAKDSIDLTVERNVLTVQAARTRTADDKVDMVVAERPIGTFRRQLFLGDTLDTDRVEANYDVGVLTLTIPVAERAKPRRLSVGSNQAPGTSRAAAVEATSDDGASSPPVESREQPVGSAS